MTGTRVVAPGRAGAALFALLLAAALGAGGAAWRQGWLAMLALLPASLGACGLHWRQRRLELLLAEQRLEVAGGPRIAYRDLLEVRPACPPRAHGLGLPAAFPIEIVHTRGRLRLPARLDPPSPEVYAFLRAKLPPCGPGLALTPALLDYRRTQEQSFGSERVWTYTARRPSPPDRRGAQAAGTALLATGASWTGAGATGLAAGFWTGLGLGALTLAGLLMLHVWSTRRPAAKPVPAALVISPLGLALAQGPLNGHVAWEEVQRVEFSPAHAFWAAAPREALGIRLVVAGAVICIADVYDRPLQEIHERILRHWG